MKQVLYKLSAFIFYLSAAAALASTLFVNNSFFYPFVTTKSFIFRVAVELMTLAFLGLWAFGQNYKLRFTTPQFIITLFIGVAAISSALGGNFYLSFWGNMERSEGLILWLHLWVFLLLLVSGISERKHWHALMDFSLAISIFLSLFGLGQALQVGALLRTSGTRVDSTFGNAAFLAVYMLFHMAIAAYLLIKRRENLGFKIYYSVLIALFAWVVIATQTRGAFLGLIAGIAVACLLSVFGPGKNPQLKKLTIGALIVIFAGMGILWLTRENPIVRDTPVLHRIISISPNDKTSQTRFVTWSAAWSGWKDKFILGYGLENFDYVFDRHFPPTIYEQEGSQVWYDRAHNLIFDRGVTTGAVGLAIYLLFIFYPLYGLYKIWKNRDQSADNKAIAIIFSALIVAFFVQDLFVFETITTYIILFFTWSFLAAMEFGAGKEWRLVLPKWGVTALGVGYAVVLIPMLWQVNILPAQANLAATFAMQSDPQKEDFFVIVDRFKKAVSAPTYGQEEYRLQFIEFVDQQLASVGEVVEKVKPVISYTDQLLDLQLKENPNSERDYLLAMRHYNYTYAADPATKVERLNKSLSYFPKAVELSPTREQIYQEAGYSNLYLYRYYKDIDKTQAAAAYTEAEKLFNKTIELNPKVVESYVDLIQLYLQSGESDKVMKVVEAMDKSGAGWRTPVYLNQLSNLAKANKRTQIFGYFSEQAILLNPDNVTAWVNLAVYYASNGDKAKAIEIAEKIKTFGGDYVNQAEIFIQNVKAGKIPTQQ